AASLGLVAIKYDPIVAVNTLALVADSAVSDYLFAAVPLFVLMGLIVGAADIGRDSLQATHWLLRRLKGGLGVATVGANAVFAAITGISIASAAIFSRVAVPPLIEHGYTRRFAVGLVAGSSVLGMLIPPSLLLIVYGLVAEVSINRLFIAAIVPGLILTLAFAAGVVTVATLRPRFAVTAAIDTGSDVTIDGRTALVQMVPVALLIVAVLGGIYGGVFTPTEAGAVGSLAAATLALVMRRTTAGKLVQLLQTAAASAASILFLIIAASAFAIMLTLSGIPESLSAAIAAANLGITSYAFCYLVLLIILGMVLDSTSILLIMVPLALPAVRLFGGDLVWFGIITVIGVEIGLLTPPLGLSVYAIKASLDDETITLNDIFLGALPFTIIMLAVTALLIFFPWLTSWI
ncbi:MAG: TRAP transporter large permease, partial [Gammaproteobacteria bacterium]